MLVVQVHAEDCGGRNPDEGISFVALAKVSSLWMAPSRHGSFLL